MNKNILPIFLLFLFGSVLVGQTATPIIVSSCGGFVASSAGSVSFTLGELATITDGNQAGILTQGFQQPEPSGIVSTTDPVAFENLVLYPNPTDASVMLQFTSQKNFYALWKLMAEDGRTVGGSERFTVSSGKYQEKIDLTLLPAGIYYFMLSNEIGGKQSAKIIKL
jgi:hypothetical protein